MKEKEIKSFFASISLFIFKASFITLLATFFLEYMKTGIVSNSVPFHLLLIITVIFAIISMYFQPFSQRRQVFFSKIGLALVLSFLFGFIVLTLLPEERNVGLYRWIPIISGCSMFLSLILFFEKND